MSLVSLEAQLRVALALAGSEAEAPELSELAASSHSARAAPA